MDIFEAISSEIKRERQAKDAVAAWRTAARRGSLNKTEGRPESSTEQNGPNEGVSIDLHEEIKDGKVLEGQQSNGGSSVSEDRMRSGSTSALKPGAPERLLQWYKLDENAVPPVYRLQNIR